MEGTTTTRGLWLLALLLARGGPLSAFNLDGEDVLRRDGDPGSLFGFSLAMHRQLYPEDKRILLVGAPQAKALNGQKSKVTGGMYKCEMSSNSDACSRVVFDDNEDSENENKENQWMGVTVSSQGPGGKVLTCAHRYKRQKNVDSLHESRDIIGRCYVLSQDLTIDPSSSEDGGSWHFCNNRNRGHERFGSCQQGISATFDKDFHYFIFGAPGAYNWKGVVRLEQKNDTFIDMGIYDDGPFEAGDETEKKPDLVPSPPNSYMGFSLDSGKSLTNKGQLTVVAGAPRAYYSGAVFLLKKGGEFSRVLLEEFTLKGEGLASSFGYDLTVLDLNGDGWDDIVVGAPQYFEKDSEIGGAVYVYINKAGKWNEVEPIRIDGPAVSMFGLAVENLGDINQDGYQDFAVGAPHEDSGAGKVYIYHGSARGGITDKASQVLSSKSAGVRQFGYSLAGNMDLDKNSYPDLAVGSLSDSVFVYRARPVVHIQKKITFSPSKINLSQKNCGNTFCLKVKTCFTYTANPSSYAPRLTVGYSLEADADRTKNNLLPRASFTEISDSDANNIYKGTITMDTKGREQCFTRQLAIQENIKDKLRAIPIDVSVNIQDARRKRRQTQASQLSPALDSNDAQPTRNKVEFIKEGCGNDNACQSNLMISYRYGYRTTDEDEFTPLNMENGVPVFSLSNQKDIALEVTVKNPHGDDAYEASVIANFPSSLSYSAYRVSPEKLQVTCIANKNGSMADCELGNPFKRDSETTFYLILGTAGISVSTSELEVELVLKTTSTQQNLMPVKAKAKVAIVLQMSLSGQVQPSQVYFSGKVKGEMAMKTENDIGSGVTYQFRIINLGKRLTDLGTATLQIEWPKSTKYEKWLLYLMKISSTGVEQVHCTPKEENLLNLEPVKTRMRRAAEITEEKTEYAFSRQDDNKETLSCGSTANCVTIRCPLGDLDRNALITLKSRLWNSTFIEDYSKFHHVEVLVKASLHVDSATTNTMLRNAETTVKLSVFPERRSAQYGGVPWWIIVLSILLGLLLLALLAFLLWKCGFFSRAKYEDKVPSYSAVRIRREERAVHSAKDNWGNLETKPWMTTWHDKEHYS
ncbi:integrin alpha-6-like isoform X1 [Poeciliopsis prolifica]|uniref:integrin alpha-6-like isoform X1 n=1 Tax=Poeciliopsis prolifica TaxID=188132 RepID=UPI00241326FB|nr:integrin alpha-6-like isoform X1 [Poeciliopsis prolifica]